MTTTHLAVVAHALDVPLETLGQWHTFRPEAFHPGPDGYHVATIAQAGRDWAKRRPHETVDLVDRLQRAAAVVLSQGDLFGDIASHIKRIAPTVIELAKGEQTPKNLATLRAIVEAALARCRAAGLDLDNASVPAPAVPAPPAEQFAAALDAEL